MYCPALGILPDEPPVDATSEADLQRLDAWCEKAWDSKLKKGLFFQGQMTAYACCSTFVDRELTIAGGHPADQAIDLHAFLHNHQITGPASLRDALLNVARTKLEAGSKMVFPSINRSHSGRKVRSTKFWSLEAELAASERRAVDLELRNFQLQEMVRKQRVTVLGLEREKSQQEEKVRSLRDLVALLKARNAILEAAKMPSERQDDSFVRLADESEMEKVLDV